ncbi:hypothetical protein L1987_23619 [Smallanthus sonchifolius]|uniref:Uncharacterized protein n=1 Tax=Smallanthus sonchifolius TaxID=185202 RepID=A0ACB9IJM9_9ASTR|nr:hypothetical protein L1987_23619 [Smallanthus sonchifolius]
MLFREQQIQRAARYLDATKVQVHVASQIHEDEALALQLQEQLNKEDEEREKQKTVILISQGEDADYLEKLSNKEIYKAFMGQQGELAKNKRAEEEKARLKSRKVIALNKRTYKERKVMMDFLKARGESGKRLGPMNFMNLQALYRQVKKEEEERLKKTNQTKRASTTADERKPKKPITDS